ncbi:helix-turn-helix transcriptional regulator [Myroides sp. NP-2]|uniref:helix-turn-helix transcriptional regulator n=1 Tax=Myroides sp. NP-2 TaxID=2759945 RepID=UPI0015FBF411|nr:AraC family transcriptional regulator [Myroides sp. NP-2]MBB1150322.1 helix-turn-helix transcriptional regulator [Myroides sp. NP-2]
MRLTTTIKNTNFKLADQEWFNTEPLQTETKEQTWLFQDDVYGRILNSCSIVGAFCIHSYLISTKKALDIEFETNREGVQQLFILDDTFEFNHQLVRKLPKGVRKFKLPATKKPVRYVSIFIPLDTYTCLLEQMKIHYTFPPLNTYDILTSLLEQSQNIRPEMLDIIQIIVSCERKGSLRSVYLQNKIEELLFLQLEQSFKQEIIGTTISARDQAKIKLAENFITQKLDHTFSLKDIAQHIGSNEFKLKTQFKIMYGTTVFGYITQLKMNKAKQLLTQTELSVTEIAEVLGYKSQNHFSTVFKKQHGYTPSELKKKRCIAVKQRLLILFSSFLSAYHTLKEGMILGLEHHY